MDVARLNFSHATHEDHKRLIRALRVAAKGAGKLVPIVGDLQGPKIRLGNLPESGMELETGSRVTLSTAASVAKDGIIPVTYKGLHKDVKKGDRIFIDDGLLELVIERIEGQKIHVRVVNGGRVSSHKGMNFPDSTLRVVALTVKDREDVLFGIAYGVEWFALSFVTNPEDVRKLKAIIQRATPKGEVPARVIVKIEKHEAVSRFDEILKVADGIMIARGDLGIEIPAQEVPVRQKEMIEKCRLAGKPVIVATQMLDSMIRNPRPTRAEVSDVANAVFDHTDAVMLSGETATGKYPLAAVKTMSNIVKEAEHSRYDDIKSKDSFSRLAVEGLIDGVLVSHGLAPLADTVLRNHPEIPLFLACANEREARQHALRWGTVPFVMSSQKESTFVERATAMLKNKKLIKKGARLAIVMGKRSTLKVVSSK
jgi:pyruvate kinase